LRIITFNYDWSGAGNYIILGINRVNQSFRDLDGGEIVQNYQVISFHWSVLLNIHDGRNVYVKNVADLTRTKKQTGECCSCIMQKVATMF
jgi:hypothetical protein